MSTIDVGHKGEGTPVAIGASRAARAPRTRASIATRAVFVALAYVIVTGGLLAGLLLQLREEAVSAAKRELGAFAQLTATHTYEVAFDLEQRLKLAEVTLSLQANSTFVVAAAGKCRASRCSRPRRDNTAAQRNCRVQTASPSARTRHT